MVRRTLINAYAKETMRTLQKDYPELSWYLTIKDNREVMIGCNKEGKAVVIGNTYESVVDMLSLNYSINK